MYPNFNRTGDNRRLSEECNLHKIKWQPFLNCFISKSKRPTNKISELICSKKSPLTFSYIKISSDLLPFRNIHNWITKYRTRFFSRFLLVPNGSSWSPWLADTWSYRRLFSCKRGSSLRRKPRGHTKRETSTFYA